jgi:G2/mitotic-specific cyclin 3/4
MLGAGGLKMAAKRTAFGDVSNTAKNISSVNDDLVTIGKNNGYDAIQKPSAPQEKSAAFLRPAQRPLAGLKGFLSNNSVVHPAAPAPTSVKAPLVEAPQPVTKPRALSKRATTIYKDPTTVDNEQVPQPAVASVLQNNASIAPVHQALGPRQHKSQPQLKVDQPSLRQTQSKHIETFVEAPRVDPIPAPSNYEDAVEQHFPSEPHISQVVVEKIQEEQYVEEMSLLIQEDLNKQDRHLPQPPLVSEPEEYWEEEEEEEAYDEQGYTTAHSYRSRGENTTGGATTVLFPKVTNKIKKELAIAKDIVENARTAEEIEDEAWDTSMVAEYGDEIFSYMRELEVSPFRQTSTDISRFMMPVPLDTSCGPRATMFTFYPCNVYTS